MKSSKKVLIVALVIASIFGYSQYAFASQINVVITESQLLEKNGEKSTYNVQLEFNNPSLLILNAGETEFMVSVNDEKIGDGKLEPFVLSAMSSTLVNGVFHTEKTTEFSQDEKNSKVKISGITKYDVFFTSLDIPFVYYPSEEQSRAFIQQS